MKPRFRVPVGKLGVNQIVLEMEAPEVLPLSRELAGHLDDIRTMLLRKSIGPAGAHALLLKVVRLNREKLLDLAGVPRGEMETMRKDDE